MEEALEAEQMVAAAAAARKEPPLPRAAEAVPGIETKAPDWWNGTTVKVEIQPPAAESLLSPLTIKPVKSNDPKLQQESGLPFQFWMKERELNHDPKVDMLTESLAKRKVLPTDDFTEFVSDEPTPKQMESSIQQLELEYELQMNAGRQLMLEDNTAANILVIKSDLKRIHAAGGTLSFPTTSANENAADAAMDPEE
jgi:hypothetical protein